MHHMDVSEAEGTLTQFDAATRKKETGLTSIVMHVETSTPVWQMLKFVKKIFLQKFVCKNKDGKWLLFLDSSSPVHKSSGAMCILKTLDNTDVCRTYIQM